MNAAFVIAAFSRVIQSCDKMARRSMRISKWLVLALFVLGADRWDSICGTPGSAQGATLADDRGNRYKLSGRIP
jgi:hypothetical protein